MAQQTEGDQFGYFAYKRDRESALQAFWQSRNLEELREWAQRGEPKADDTQNAEGEQLQVEEKPPFESMINRIVESSASQRNLIAIKVLTSCWASL